MIDLGQKIQEFKETITPEKNKVSYPYLSIDKDIGIDESDVDKIIIATVKLKVVEVSTRSEAREGQDKKKTERIEFNVLGIELNKPSRKEIGEKFATDFLNKGG